MIKQLSLFSAGSANDDNNKHLWVKGASLFIPQINELLKHLEYKFNILNIEYFNNDCKILKEILDTNKSDKANHHNYHILYSYIFNILGRNSNLNILEIGLGTNNPNLVSTMGINGRPGASLYSFSQYLPNSNIYGADIDKDILFQTDKIKTYYVDQLNFLTFIELSKKFNGKKFDLIIDDGLHSIGANLNTLLFALDNLNDYGWIVIEDIHILDNWKVIDFIISSTKKYKTYVIKAEKGNLYAINKI